MSRGWKWREQGKEGCLPGTGGSWKENEATSALRCFQKASKTHLVGFPAPTFPSSVVLLGGPVLRERKGMASHPARKTRPQGPF